MKYSLQLVMAILICALISGCGTRMKNVLRECDKGQNFSSYSYCIKSTYDRKGTRPNSTSVRSFYANLDAITEAYNNQEISAIKAKSMTYDSFMRTVQAENNRSAPAYCQVIGSSVICY
jgi:hypothetical protein